MEESGNEEEEQEEGDTSDTDYIINIEEEANLRPKVTEDEYRFEVLTADQVVQLMVDIIKEVNTVVQVSYSGDGVKTVRSFLSCVKDFFNYSNCFCSSSPILTIHSFSV